MSSWKRDAASGLIVVVPILVSVYVVGWFYWRLAGIPVLGGLAEPVKVALLLVVFAAVVLAVGFLMRSALGSFVEGLVDSAVNQLPLIRVIYNASKMAVETALSGTDELQTPVKLEPWEGMRMTAFKTGKTAGDGRDVLFLPTAPNITTGFVIEVESSEYEEVDEKVEEALTRILSAGFGDTGEQGTPIPIEEATEEKRAPDTAE
ncbi:hypothetical protein BRC81_07020 [Halobacteriales archaeon QS_1_68_20]|nr:MAG: hypothetical protein BRC81_07020 [Halobacteriales archaeon QS_1_68_20]